MTVISNMVMRFSSEGADDVQQEQREVRNSIEETAQTAQQEQGKVQRWMERNRAALLGIGAAAAAAMYGIIRASPTLSFHLESIRTAFSMLATVIGIDLNPVVTKLTDNIWRLVEAYEGLPQPLRKVTSGLIAAGLTITAVGASAKALKFALGGLTGAFTPLVAVIGAVLTGYGLAKARLEVPPNMKWIIDIIAMFTGLAGWITFLQTVTGDLGIIWQRTKEDITTATNAIRNAIETLGEGVLFIIDWFKKLSSRIMDILRELPSKVIDLFTNLFKVDLVSKLSDWGRDAAENFVNGLIQGIQNLGSSVIGELRNQLGFDIRKNDMMALEWGVDAAKFMKKGFAQGFQTMQPNTALQGFSQMGRPNTTMNNSSSATNITIEEGAIQIMGETGTIDDEYIARRVSESIRDNYGAR